MKSIVTIAVACCVLAVLVPEFLGSSREGSDQQHLSVAQQGKLSGTAESWQDRSGHYSFNADFNGKSINTLVDTGASYVAINWSTARRIGLRVRAKDFRHNIRTANGIAKYAKGVIDEIRIDGIVVRRVTAAVLSDQALETTLLGMNFLNRLERFEFQGKKLKLVQ